MSKEDDPFGTQPSETDPFGRPTSQPADPFSQPADPFSSPADRPSSPPAASDAWRAGRAPPPTGSYAAPATARNADGATAALVLGLIGLVFCQLLSPIAWGVGRKAERQVDASGGTLGGRGQATAGKILGMVGTALIVIAIIVIIALIAVGASTIDDGGTSTTFEP